MRFAIIKSNPCHGVIAARSLRNWRCNPRCSLSYLPSVFQRRAWDQFRPRHVPKLRLATAGPPLYPSRMRVFVLAIAGLFASLAIAQQKPDVATILRKVSETYANAKQYRFTVRKSGEETGSMQIAVQQPNKFRLEANGRVIDGADAFDNLTIVSDGNTAWNYAPELNEYTRKSTTLPLLDTEPPAITPETFVFQADAVFVTRYAELAKASDHARFLRQEIVQGAGGAAECYVFELQAPLPGFRDVYTWWVDKKR